MKLLSRALPLMFTIYLAGCGSSGGDDVPIVPTSTPTTTGGSSSAALNSSAAAVSSSSVTISSAVSSSSDAVSSSSTASSSSVAVSSTPVPVSSSEAASSSSVASSVPASVSSSASSESPASSSAASSSVAASSEASSSSEAVVVSPVTLQGKVTTFPTASVVAPSGKVGVRKAGGIANYYSKLRRAGEEGAITSLTNADMVNARALVSLFLLSDVEFTTPIATVKTDAEGQYQVRAKDVKAYLVTANKITEEATDDDILVAFRLLGKLQVRALVVKEENGVQRALAIQSIADPTALDESGEPAPVAVNPIVHSVVKGIINKIRSAINSLKDMGVDAALVDQLAASVVEDVAATIIDVVAAAADDIIQIPEGQSIESVVKAQEDEFEINLPPDEIESLNTLVISDDEELTDEQITGLEETTINADEVISEEDSTLGASLGSDSQGLLSGLDSILSENINSTVEERIEEDAALLFGVSAEDQAALDAKLAEQALQKSKQLTIALQRFFLSMGLGVVLEQNAAGDAAVVALNVQAPFFIDNCELPGGQGFGDRGIRLFKVGEGVLDDGSAYSSVKPACGEIASDTRPVAQSLADVVAELPSQDDIDAAFERIAADSNSPLGSEFIASQADYELIDQVRLYHELNNQLSDATLVSEAVITSLVANRSVTVKIGYLAKVLADNFKWGREKVNVTPEGFPIFTGRSELLATGASTVESSELVRALSLSLASDPSAAAKFLTERLSFYAQFSPDAVQSAIENERYASGDAFDVATALGSIYPTVPEGYKDLVIGVSDGAVNVAGAPAYRAAQERVVRGLTSSVPASLFGQTLTSESTINIRAALFFMDLIIKSDFLIEKDKGYFTALALPGVVGDRYIPNFENYKFMRANDSVSMGTLVSSLLNITQINNGEFFKALSSTLAVGLSDLPTIPEFKEQNIEELEADLGGRAEFVTAECTIERFDGTDPNDKGLELSVFPVEINPETGEFFKGDAVADVTFASELLEGEGSLRRTYTIGNISSQMGDQFGREYVIRLKIPGYQNDLPELFIFVDGYADTINICDAEFPLFIGPDQQFTAIPGLGLMANQMRFDGNGDEAPEGVDLSNFEVPGAPIYVSSFEEEQQEGLADFYFGGDETGYAISGAEGVGFAPLFGQYQNGELVLSIEADAGLEPLFGMHSIQSTNLRGVVEDLLANELLLEPEIIVDRDIDNWQYDRLYLMRDRKGIYWVIELRFLDFFLEPNGEEVGFIDIGFAGISNVGSLDIPEAGFDDFSGAPTDGSDVNVGPMYNYLAYGDWLIIESPSDYAGPQVLPAQELSFGGSQDDYTQLAAATDGIVIRYASEHFEEKIVSASDFDTVFGSPPDFSTIPVRIDAGREGITFVNLSFNKQDRKYTMTPAPENAKNFVTNLKHNNIIAIFDNNVNNGESPVYLARVIRDKPAGDPWANFEISLEIVPFMPSAEGDISPDEVVCFAEETRPCPGDLPNLYLSSALDTSVGVVFDSDFDGVPFVFDPNDQDPNIPGSIAPSSSDNDGFNEGLAVFIAAESAADVGTVKSLIVETVNVYPGEIQAVVLDSDIFGGDSDRQVIFTCTPPKLDASTENFTDFQCTSRSVDGGVTISLDSRSGDGVAFQLTVPDSTLSELGGRVDIDYEITFRVPTDLEGNLFMCGNEVCPARPSLPGALTIRIPDDIAVLSEMRIALGTDEPTDFGGLSSLDVTRGFTLTGATINGAKEYELNVFCAGSLPGENYLPEENMSFYAPAFDAAGQNLRPEFFLDIPWVGGRTCDFTFEAELENDAGDFVGVSVLRFDDVVVSGGAGNGGGFVDNEIKIELGQSLCLSSSDGFTIVSNENCEADVTLLTLLDTVIGDEADSSAIIELGGNVTEAFADGGRKDLTGGRLEANALVTFNVNLDVADGAEIEAPTCGFISSDEFSNTCGDHNFTDVLTDFFVVSPEGDSLMLVDTLLIDLQFAGGELLDFSGEIPLTTSGFYALVDPLNGEKIMEIGVDAFIDADGTSEVFAHFTLTAGGNEYQGEGDNTLELSSPGYLFVSHSSGQPVDFDIRFVRDGVIKVAWFMPPPRQALEGEHDIDGDGNTDITLSYSAELQDWTFIFADTAKRVEYFGFNGPEIIEAETDGTYAAIVSEMTGFADFMVAFDNTQYQLYVQFDQGGQGFLEWFEIYGQPTDPGGSPGECYDCPQSLFDFIFKDGQPLSLFDNADEGFNTEDIGAALLDFEIVGGEIVIRLADGAATDAYLSFYDVELGEFIEVDSVFIPVGQGALQFISFNNDGVSLDLEVFDTGFDVAVRIFEGYEPPTDTDRPEPELHDTDMDGWFDREDNCVIVPNEDQIDTDENGVGDACEAVGPEIDGVYMAELTQQEGSEVFDEDAGRCVVADDERKLIAVRSIGSQLFIHEVGDDLMDGLHGVMAEDGSFSVMGGDAFYSAGGFYDDTSGTFSFDYTDYESLYDDDYGYSSSFGDESSLDGSLETDAQSDATQSIDTESLGDTTSVIGCSETVAVFAYGPDEVNEQAVFTNGGVTWFDYDYRFDFGEVSLDVDYGIVLDNQPEVTFSWDFETQAWLDGGTDVEFFVTELGIVASDDLYAITGYGPEGEVGILQPTSNGQWVDGVESLVELASFDISGMAIEDVVGPLADGTPNEVFSDGAIAYITTLIAESTNYSFDCDHDWDADVTLVCNNGFIIDWEETVDGDLEPIFAAGLSDLISVTPDMEMSETDASSSGDVSSADDSEAGVEVGVEATAEDGDMPAAGVYVGRGVDEYGEFSVHAHITSDDGTVDGANLMIHYLANYHGGYEMPVELIASGDAALETYGDIELISFIYPDELLEEIDARDAGRFILVESELDQEPLVREGSIELSGDEEMAMTLNAIARDDIVVDFELEIPESPQPNCDMFPEDCYPPEYCDPAFEDCSPSGECDPAFEDCRPPEYCDPALQDCMPPEGCDSTMTDCYPPEDCELTMEGCYPPEDCTDGADGCTPPMQAIDFDDDGLLGRDDNCVLVYNPEQDDIDENGIGDVCESVGVEISGVYLATLTPTEGSTEYDEETGSCEAAETHKSLLFVETIGSQLFIHPEGADHKIHALLLEDGSFAIIESEDFAASGEFYDAIEDVLGFSFTETSGDEALGLCISDVTVNALPPVEVNEQEVVSVGGINWFWSGGGPEAGYFDVDYGVITDDGVEESFSWDYETAAWVAWDNSEPEYLLTEGGVVVFDDLNQITGYGENGELATLQATSLGLGIDGVTKTVELAAFDISGMEIRDVIGDIAKGVAHDAVFSDGAMAYVTELTTDATVYMFECDHLWDSWSQDNLNCANGVVLDWVEDTSADAETATSETPMLAGSFAELVSLEETFSYDLPSIQLGEGYSDGVHSSIEVIITSLDGTVTGESLFANYVHYMDVEGQETAELLSAEPLVISFVGSTEVIEFAYPETVSDLLDSDASAIFVDTTGEAMPIVRLASVSFAGEVETAFTFNAIARDDVVLDFYLEMGGEPCDSLAGDCMPHDDCNPAVEDCTPPEDCDPAVENCAPPVDCDPAVEDCAPPVDCDPVVEDCAPPVDCDPAFEDCTPPVDCDPAVEDCTPPEDCDPAVEDCAPPVGCDPAVEDCTPPEDCDPTVENCAPPEDCDPTVENCTPPEDCDPAVEDCTPPEDCDPAVEDCAPPVGCDPAVEDCTPPEDCDPTVENCAPPEDCDPTVENCTPPEDCDPAVEDCTPPEDCDPAVEDCAPPVDCDPAVEDCAPPVNCDPAVEDCTPPEDCDSTVENCAPPEDCDPAVEDCTPPEDCDPAVEDCAPPVGCDPAVEDCTPPEDCDPAVEACDQPIGDVELGKSTYDTDCAACHGADGTDQFGAFANSVIVPIREDIYHDAASLMDYNAVSMPFTAPGSCSGECAANVTAYLLELNDAYYLSMEPAVGGFPMKLAVSSPLAGLEVQSDTQAPQKVRHVLDIETLVNTVLASPSSLSSYLDMADFFRTAQNAQDCYGPTLDYEEHPDGTAGNSGQLPSGDLGIWRETMPDENDDGVEEACAAAQLNAQMDAVESRSTMALAVLAAMKANYDATGDADISADLPIGMDSSGVDFLVEEIDGGTLSSYYITLLADYNDDGVDEEVSITLVHEQDDSSDHLYEGLLTLEIKDSFNGGNCGAGENDVTRYTSVHYVKNAETDLRLQSREAQFCGNAEGDSVAHGAFSESVQGQSVYITGFVLSPLADWSDNFSVYTAAYDPTAVDGELEGRYTYTWQAGNFDSHARILDVGLSAGVAGESWFGYGDRVQDVAAVNEFGIIGGFICNWAGPNGDHTLMDYAQRQHLTLDTTAGIYTVNDNGSSSNITFAPTNSCEYDGAGSFIYDRDVDGDLFNETTDTVIVDDSAILFLDLLAVDYPGDFTGDVDATNDIPDIWEVITNARGFSLPAYPITP